MNIGLFCGSSIGNSAVFSKEALSLSALMAQKKYSLVYGAGSVGLMGVVSDYFLQNKLKVIGVVPHFLMNKEVVNENITELIVTDTMFERKRIIIDRSDAFIALPGGIGTYDEIFEVLVGMQLGQFVKPIGLLNTNNYFAPFVDMISMALKYGFLRTEHAGMVIIESDPEKLINLLETFQYSDPENWISQLRSKGHF